MHAQTIHRPRLTARQIGWGAAAALLLAPAITMLFTREMNWGMEDFAALALMLGTLGLAAEMGVRFVRTPAYRVMLAGTLALAFVLVWADLAVGILPR